MSARVVAGEVLCDFCPSVRIELGKAENGETVSIPTALRRVVESGPRGILLDCGHHVLKFDLVSAQEWVEFEDGSILQNGHLPLGVA